MRNFTDEPVDVVIKLRDDLAPQAVDVYFRFYYDSCAARLHFGMHDSYRKEVGAKADSSLRLNFVIPPRSTLFLGIGSNGQMAIIEDVSLNWTGGSDAFSSYRGLNYKRSLTGRYLAYYDLTR